MDCGKKRNNKASCKALHALSQEDALQTKVQQEEVVATCLKPFKTDAAQPLIQYTQAGDMKTIKQLLKNPSMQVLLANFEYYGILGGDSLSVCAAQHHHQKVRFRRSACAVFGVFGAVCCPRMPSMPAPTRCVQWFIGVCPCTPMSSLPRCWTNGHALS